MKTERIIDILKSAYRWGTDNGSNRSDKNFNDFLQTSQVVELMEEYASQFKNDSVKVPSDEDIENAAMEYNAEQPYTEWNDTKMRRYYQDGAKDMRDDKIYISPKK